LRPTRPPLTPEQLAARRKKHFKRRVIVYGTLIALVWGFWIWQPWEFDLVERKPEKPLPRVDPDAKKLFAKRTRILLITAHPDDSEFYIGGTLHLLSKTADIHQVIVTDGDKSYYGFLTNAEENRQVRQVEATAAKDAWKGKSISFLGYPDGRLRVTDDLVDELVEQIRTLKPDYVMAFDSDYPPRASHRDHRRTGEASALAVKKAGIPLWLMMFSTNAANYYVDVTDVWDQKEKLLAIHESQFNGERLQGVSNMVAGRAEIDGEAAGVSLAEGFRCVRIQ
jgi:LmbE family N-acetylglucosaminyl deacetylase